MTPQPTVIHRLLGRVGAHDERRQLVAHAPDDDERALENLGLITSHGFLGSNPDNRWYGPHTSRGIDALREKRPELPAWVTSTSWSKMDANFIREIYGHIYEAKVNGIIPWAGAALAYDYYFESGGRQPAQFLRGGLRIGASYDPF